MRHFSFTSPIASAKMSNSQDCHINLHVGLAQTIPSTQAVSCCPVFNTDSGKFWLAVSSDCDCEEPSRDGLSIDPQGIEHHEVSILLAYLDRVGTWSQPLVAVGDLWDQPCRTVATDGLLDRKSVV